jgi:hypothetical protein
MRAKLQPLACELHAHATWSDGELSVPELVDLHGRHGIDVLCVTDHDGRQLPGLRHPAEDVGAVELAPGVVRADDCERLKSSKRCARPRSAWSRASGDFHRPEHLAGWRTLLPCERSEEAVVAYLRSPRPSTSRSSRPRSLASPLDPPVAFER